MIHKFIISDTNHSSIIAMLRFTEATGPSFYMKYYEFMME